MIIQVKCSYCGKNVWKERGHVNRANKKGNNLYCDRECSGMAKQKHIKYSEKKEKKRLYDMKYREKNRALLKEKKSKWFKDNYDPEVERVKRAAKKIDNPEIEAARREYMKTDQYRANKKKYDRRYKAAKNYGYDYGYDYGEAMALSLDLKDQILIKRKSNEK